MFRILLTFAGIHLALTTPAFAGKPKPIWDSGLKSSVERAGVLLIKDYGPGDRGVLVLHQSKSTGKGNRQAEYRRFKGQQIPFVNFPAGQTDAGEKYSTQTAARETREETANTVQLEAGDLLRRKNSQSHGFLFDRYRKIQMFVLKNNYSVRKIAANVMATFKNNNLPSDRRESVNAFVIPTTDLWVGIRRLAKTWDPRTKTFSKDHKLYVFYSRGDGKGNNRKPVHICGQYLRALAAAYNSANYVEQLFQKL